MYVLASSTAGAHDILHFWGFHPKSPRSTHFLWFGCIEYDYGMTFWPGFWSETTLEQHPVHEHTLHGLPALAYQSEMKVNRSRACSLHSRPRQASYGSPGPQLCLYGSPQPPLQRGSTLVRSDFTEKAARLCIAGRWSGCQVKPLASTPASS